MDVEAIGRRLRDWGIGLVFGIMAARYSTLALQQFGQQPGSQSSLYLAFVAARLALVGVLLIVREPPLAGSRRGFFATGELVAAVSTFVPAFLYSTQAGPLIFAPQSWAQALWLPLLAGDGLSLWGTISLGRSFGISPAVRPWVRRGPYRWVDHPIYLGYALTESAWVLMVPSPRNFGVWVFSVALYVLRARLEVAAHRRTIPN